MRHVRWPILLACLSIPVLGQDAPHSIYNNVASMEAIGADPTTSSATGGSVTAAPASSPQQSDYDAAKQRFDAASDQLMYARNDVIARMANDPKYQAANRGFVDAKNNYDSEIDDALSALSYDDQYEQLVDAANRAAANLQSLNEFGTQPNQQTEQYAQSRMDEARKAVEDYEDDVLDHDTYVQQARQKFETARAARDRILTDAFAKDQKVQEAEANVNREQIALDAAAAKLGQSSVAQNGAAGNGGPQAPTSPLPTDETAGAEGYSGQGPVIYDAGDGTEVGPSYVPPTYEPAYSYDEDLNSPYYYPPYYSYYPYGYPGGIFLFASPRDHHRFFFHDRDIFRYHDRRDGQTWTRGPDGRHIDWNDGRDMRNVPAMDGGVEGAQLAAERQAAETSQNRADEVRQREEWRARISQQMNDAAARQSQADQQREVDRGPHVWTGRQSGDPQPVQQQQRTAEEQAARQQRAEQQQVQQQAQQQQAEENARAQQAAEAQSRAAQEQQAAQAERAAQQQQAAAAQSRQSSQSSHSEGGYHSSGGGSAGGHWSGGGGGGGSHHR